ncbi:MAG: hypothetical protein JW822_02580 [Spirochaetales bacterium]|nr:hypothetical protein [Spirochaetales bacterium]
MLGEDENDVIQNHSIDDSFLTLKINPYTFTQVEIGVIARHDVNLMDMSNQEIVDVIRLHKAQVSVDVLNTLGIEAFPLSTTLTVGLVDKEDLDPARITHHELEDVSRMEVEDWGVCIDYEMALIGLRAVVATSQLDKAWPHTLVSLYGKIDPVLFELAVEAADDGSSAIGHFGATVGYEFYINQNLNIIAGLDVDFGFAQGFNELISWGAGVACAYTEEELAVKASLAAEGRFGRDAQVEVTGQAFRGVSAAFEVWPISVLGFGVASVLSVYEEAPSLLANCEIAVLLKLGMVEFALGYVIIPEGAGNEPLAEKLVWATDLKGTQGENISGLFFMTKIEF